MRTWIEKNEFNEDVERKEHDSGHVIKELKMTDAQKAQMAAAAAVPPPDPLAGVTTRLDKLIADMTEVKADVKAIKAKG